MGRTSLNIYWIVEAHQDISLFNPKLPCIAYSVWYYWSVDGGSLQFTDPHQERTQYPVASPSIFKPFVQIIASSLFVGRGWLFFSCSTSSLGSCWFTSYPLFLCRFLMCRWTITFQFWWLTAVSLPNSLLIRSSIWFCRVSESTWLTLL